MTSNCRRTTSLTIVLGFSSETKFENQQGSRVPSPGASGNWPGSQVFLRLYLHNGTWPGGGTGAVAHLSARDNALIKAGVNHTTPVLNPEIFQFQ